MAQESDGGAAPANGIQIGGFQRTGTSLIDAFMAGLYHKFRFNSPDIPADIPFFVEQIGFHPKDHPDRVMDVFPPARGNDAVMGTGAEPVAVHIFPVMVGEGDFGVIHQAGPDNDFINGIQSVRKGRRMKMIISMAQAVYYIHGRSPFKPALENEGAMSLT